MINLHDIHKEFNTFFQRISNSINSKRNGTEEDLKSIVELEIITFLKKYDINIEVEYEAKSIGTTKIKGRIDALYNNVIIEYKKYGILNNKKKLATGIQQIEKQYLENVKDKVSYIGILFDGVTIVFFNYNPNQNIWDKRQYDFDKNALYEWIKYLSSSTKKQVSPKALKDDFSLDKDIPIEFISQLYLSLLNNENPRVKMLFNEWDKTFRYVYGGILDELNIENTFKEIFNNSLVFNKEDIEIDKFLFVIYTYYAFIVKLFASEIACVNMKITPETPLRIIRHSKNLKEILSYVENGNFFRDIAHVDNYIEGGFFSWYLEVMNNDMEKSMNDLLLVLNDYEPNSFFLNKTVSRDLLKSLYEDIIPKKIRHDLGEYYTPDWLAQISVDESGFNGNESSKVLDPACGSGAFIVEFINRVKLHIHNNHKNMKNNEIVDYICQRVIGFDVNPVAILTARTNYLIAISPYLDFNDEQQITLPIFLADSIITPTTEGNSNLEKNSYKISTVEGIFSIPKSLLEKNLLSEILRIVEETVYLHYPLEDFNKILKNKSIFLDIFEQKEIDAFYIKILELHEVNKNQIWAKIILNSFAPLLYNNFSHIVGNPPWIKWDFLSKEYREKLSVLYLDIYKLFAHKGMKASLGHAHDDISILFTYIAMDKYLKNKGTLTFVLKQTLYKSIAGEQFRKFSIDKFDSTTPVKCVKVHDMLSLNPFGQGQETSIVTLEKNATTTYPVPYVKWQKNVRARFKSTDTNSYVLENCLLEYQDAYPDPMTKKITDPWIIIPKGQKIPKISNKLNFYKARHGVVNDLNSLFLIDIIEPTTKGIKVKNLGEKGKKKIKILTKNIETDLIYPLIKPRDTKRWGIETYQYMIVPHQKAGENNESFLRTELPKSYAFLNSFKTELATRKSKWFYGGDKPFYSLFGIGKYTFENYKVVWCCMSYKPDFSVVSKVKDEHIGIKTYIPDNTIGYLSVESADEAHYICSILNSDKIKALFSLRSSKSKWGISIDMVNKVPIEEFSQENNLHIELVSLSKKAHKLKDAKKIEAIEDKINNLINKHNVIE